jgi:hypothetical protein
METDDNIENFMLAVREPGGLARIANDQPDNETEVRLKIVYIFMTAAQALIESGRDFAARGFLQSGRIVASYPAGFLLLNHAQIEIDLIEADKIISARVKDYERKAKTR